MSVDPRDINKAQAVVETALREHWKLFLIEGIVLLILGGIAVIVPPLATLTVTLVLGWLFLISGAIGLYTTWQMRTAPGFWWSLVSAALAILVGGMLLARPVTGAVSLTLVLIAFFVVEGIASIMYASSHRNTPRWGWLLASGVVDLVLAVMIFAGLPGAAAWAVGLLVGINMIFGGTALIAMALGAKKAG
jgi:uncharacterized membrane protein HdeD (DUF308 family)